MQVHGPSHVHGPHGVNAPHHPRLKTPAGGEPTTGTTGDSLDISPAAEAAIRAAEAGETSAARVARIRNEIAAGTYETPEKLDRAVDRLLDDIV